MDSNSQCRWQFRHASEQRWEWLPYTIGEALTAAANDGKQLETIFDPSIGEINVDLSLKKIVSGTSGITGDVRSVPSWWGEDANLAAGILVACDAEDGVQVLFGVEDRPWWPEKQAGPFWGFVEPTDQDLPSAMAREAVEETLGVLGSQDDICACLRSDTHSVPVCLSPWHEAPGAPGGRLEILRLVNLGSLNQRERKAVQQSFRHRRSLALAAASAAALSGVQASPASHLEVEELHWTSAISLFETLQVWNQDIRDA